MECAVAFFKQQLMGIWVRQVGFWTALPDSCLSGVESMAGTVSVSLHGLTALCRLTAWPDWNGCNV